MGLFGGPSCPKCGGSMTKRGEREERYGDRLEKYVKWECDDWDCGWSGETSKSGML